MRLITGITIAALATAQAAIAQDSQQSDFARMQAEFNKVPDTPGDGPYPAIMQVDPALPDHVIYRPADLAPLASGGLGLFVWGNGGCADDGASSRLHLAQIASYGYLVIAPGKWRSGPNAREGASPPREPGADGALPAPATTSDDLRTALDWALASDGQYHTAIDQDAIAVGGFSCGGLQALELAGDPRIDTVVVQNSGIFNAGSGSITGMTPDKALLQQLHTPVIYVLGGESDIAWANGTDDFARIGHVPAALVSLPVGHGGTYNEPMGGKAASIVVDWLQWQLRDDAGAARTFLGANCRLCTSKEVELRRKGMDRAPGA